MPWWTDHVGGAYRTAFVSNLIPPARVARHLGEIAPDVLSCYPSNLEALLPHAREFIPRLRLATTHSEYSSPASRRAWSEELGVPVLDEYSSEEATRIALELPCGHYHVCEDTVHLDVLDPETMQLQAPGQPGLVVVTNLLNEVMPFIRYVQGDYVTRPAEPAPCSIGWSQLASLDGRANDSFRNREGRSVPAGSILDVTYRWMYDAGVNMREFELVQEAPDRVRARFVPDGAVAQARLRDSVRYLEDLLGLCLEHPVRVEAEVLETLPRRSGKKRPIRRGFE